MIPFADRLGCGQIAEGKIAKWLKSRGHSILPVYEKEIDTGKGPRIFRMSNTLVAPDMLIFKGGGEILWGEAKRKTVFAWYSKRAEWRTGIDINHYNDYLQVRHDYGLPLWLFFLHECSTPDALSLKWRNCPDECPTGLFGQEITLLAEHEGNRDDGQGHHGMVYWAHESLRLLAPLSEFR